MESWTLHIRGHVAEGDHDAPQLLETFVGKLQQHGITVDQYHPYRGMDDDDTVGFFVQGQGDIQQARTYLTEFVADLRSKGLQIEDAVAIDGKVRNDLGLAAAAGTESRGTH